MNVVSAMVLLIPLYIQTISAFCEMYHFVVTEKLAMEGHVIKTVTKPFDRLCWSDCVWLPSCLSINVRKTSLGMFECELNNSSRVNGTLNKMAPKEGWFYHEMEEINNINCEACECKIKKELGNGWYRYGNSKIKLFTEKKNWTDARSHCQSLGGDLLSITSSHENDFINDVFVKTLDSNNATGNDLPWPGIYWKMNGAEAEIKLLGDAGNAKYIFDGKENALYLNGHHAYARFPGVTLNPEGFSMAVWLRPLNQTKQYIAAIGMYNNVYFKGLIKIMHIPLDQGMSVTIKNKFAAHTYFEQNQWRHFAITWKNTTSILKYFYQGKRKKMVERPDLSPIVVTSDDHFLAGTNGNYSTLTKTYLGALKHVMIANKTLQESDIQTAMYWNENGPWIGLHSPSNSPTFRWSDGTSNTILNTFPDYTPEPLVSDRKCAILIDKKWLDKPCYLKNPYICKVTSWL